MEDYKKIVGERLRKFLKSKGLTNSKAAEFLKTTEGSLKNSYLNGKSLPGASILFYLMKLGCDIHWLLDPSNTVTDLPDNPIYTPEQSTQLVKELQKELEITTEENKKLIARVEEFEEIGVKVTEYIEAGKEKGTASAAG